MYRVIVDRDFCQGHAVCADEAPEVFRVGDDDKVELIREEIPPELVEKVRTACTYCPTRSIRLEET